MESNAQERLKRIILCIDGEEATKKAVDYAVEITSAWSGNLTALHVINPYLKKFANEIYAVGRNEYKDHIDRELSKEAESVISEFKQSADDAGLSYAIVLRYGSPEEEIIKEISENPYDLLILGAGQASTLKAKIRSFNLPKKIFGNMKIPTLFVR